MSRDTTRNIETFKIGGTHVNDFEFHKHQGEMSERTKPGGKTSGTVPLTRAERVAQVMAEAHRKAEKRKKKVKNADDSKPKSAAGTNPEGTLNRAAQK